MIGIGEMVKQVPIVGDMLAEMPGIKMMDSLFGEDDAKGQQDAAQSADVDTGDIK